MRPGTPGAGGVTLDHDRLDLGGVDLTGLPREDVLAALTDAALEAFDELGPADFAVALRPVRFVPWAAEFAFDPNEPRDEAGKWTAGAGGGGTKSERSAARVERKRAERAAGRQARGEARHLNGVLRDRARDIARAHGLLPDSLPTPALDRAVAALSPAPGGPTPLHGEALPAKLAAFERVRDEAEREIEVTESLNRLVPRREDADALERLREVSHHAARAADHLSHTLWERESRFSADPGGNADAEFYSPDQPRDDRGRWTSAGLPAGGQGEGAAPRPTQADRAALRQSSLAAVRAYVRAGGEPTHVEHEQLAAHLARLTVDQLHAVKVEHGLKASGKVKSDLVARLAERFRLHRAKQEPAGKKALAEATAGREGWHAPRDVMGGVAALHGPTGARVRADSAGTMFDVLAPGSELHSSHATAGEAVRAAEASGRFGTGGTTAEREHAARQEAIAKSRERAAQAKPAGQSAAGLAPEVVAQHQVPYKGASLDNSHAQEQLGFPKALETLRSWPADKLQAERRDLLRSSYGMFGQNAKKLLAVVEQVIRERHTLQSARHAPFDDADAPLRPVRFVPLVQPPPSAEFAPGGQEDARR